MWLEGKIDLSHLTVVSIEQKNLRESRNLGKSTMKSYYHYEQVPPLNELRVSGVLSTRTETNVGLFWCQVIRFCAMSPGSAIKINMRKNLSPSGRYETLKSKKIDWGGSFCFQLGRYF